MARTFAKVAVVGAGAVGCFFGKHPADTKSMEIAAAM